MDKIIMQGMKFFGQHGVLHQEKELGQRFEVDLVLELDLEEAAQRDNLAATVSYADVYRVVEEIVTGPPFHLIEAVAGAIARAVLESFAPVQEVTVRIKKPGAPVPGIFDHVAVEISRRRAG